MDEGVTSPVSRPPVPLEPPNVVEFAVGELLHRVHDSQFNGNQFNPCKGGQTRFAPIHDDNGQCIPTLYAADSVEAAIYETVLHDIPLHTFHKSAPLGAVCFSKAVDIKSLGSCVAKSARGA